MRNRLQKIVLRCILLPLALNVTNANATNRYVSATATTSGTGTFANPWQFQAALDHPAALLPGDTVWMRGGTYYGTDTMGQGHFAFDCHVNGTTSAPIIFRNYDNERVIIDGKKQDWIINMAAGCSNTWFWGLEVMSSSTAREFPGGDYPQRGSLWCLAPDMKFINMILHDCADGIDLWLPAINAELYGSVIYNNGWNITNNGGHGHGIYTQNDTPGTKIIHDNIFFNSYAYNVKLWSTGQSINNYDIQRNIVFNGGSNYPNYDTGTRNHNFFVVANNPLAPATNLVIKHNYTFAGNNYPRPPVNAFGLNYGIVNMVLDSNYLTDQLRLGTLTGNISIKDNAIIGNDHGLYPYWGFLTTDYPQNNYSYLPPTAGMEYFVIPNKYESGRANIAIYNWANATSVVINVANIGLAPGDNYELINVNDYFNDIVTGTYSGNGDITVAMTGHTTEAAIGSTIPAISQFPTFGSFVIRKTSTTSVKTVNTNALTVSVAPNPFNDKCTFKLENAGAKKYSVIICNILGSIVRRAEFENNIATVAKGSLAAGTYTYIVRDEAGNNVTAGRVAMD